MPGRDRPADDLEQQNLAAASLLASQYGTAEGAKIDQEAPIMVSHEKALYAIVYAYAGYFALHRLADVAYLCTADGRFPKGLGHLYPSDEERLQTISYTHEVVACQMLQQTTVFCIVIAMIYFKGFARLDLFLRTRERSFGEYMSRVTGAKSAAEAFELFCAVCIVGFLVFFLVTHDIGLLVLAMLPAFALAFSLVYNGDGPRLEPVRRRMTSCCCAPIGSWCSKLGDRLGFRLTFRELCHGGFYLAVLAALFSVVTIPFHYWMQDVDLRFGFANSLTITADLFWESAVADLIHTLTVGIIGNILFIGLLQCRFGWLVMWLVIVLASAWAQLNFPSIAPMMMDMSNRYPDNVFAVGRGFPIVNTGDPYTPWVSLNRIYYRDPMVPKGYPQFATSDKSLGTLVLTRDGPFKDSAQRWRIVPVDLVSPKEDLAHTNKDSDVDKLNTLDWSVGNMQTRVGLREGRHLRDKLQHFARQRNLSIGEIYMVDGSHQDARANAFVGGTGNFSIIGLYDTLFLGSRQSESEQDEEQAMSTSGAFRKLVQGEPVIELSSDELQGVDSEADDEAPRNSAPTMAMSDDEIMSILAHELAHPALGHLERGMVVQAVSTFITFAALGLVSNSPLTSAALSLPTTMVHVGMSAYDHIVGPLVNGGIKLVTDWVTRKGEYEADAYAAGISLEIANALQMSLAKLSVNANQDPDEPYFYEALHTDHPTFAHRWANIEEVKKKLYPNQR